MVRLRIGALVAATAILATACGGAASTASPAASAAAPSAAASAAASPESQAPASTAPKTGGTLVVGIPGDLTRTDSSLIDDGPSVYVEQNVIETLVTLSPGTSDKIVPLLADSWTVSSDGLTYTFKLHQGVKFHDGTPFDAAAVKANFEHWLNIPASYSTAGYTYYIDTVIGKGDGSNIAKVDAPDAGTFVLTLKTPNSALLVQLTLTMFGMQSPTAMKAGNADAPNFADNKYAQGGPGAMVGTGPFKFKEWTLKDHITIEKNADYWGDPAAGPFLDAVNYRPISDPTAMLNALQAGDVDLVQSFSPVDVKTIKADTSLQYFDRGSACNAGTLKMNQNHKPFDNVKIRQAVAYAINRQAIVDAFFGDTGVVLKNWAPPGTKFAKDQDIPNYDPEKAKALIAESGVTDLSFDAWYPSDVSRPYMPDPKGEFEAILNDLQAVGFKPNPQTSTWSPDFLNAANAGQYPMFLVGWNCDWLGIDNFLQTGFFGYQSGKPNAAIAYKNDAMNDAMVKAIQAPDDATAQAEWDKAQAFLVQDMPIVPIVSAITPAAGKATIRGFVPSPTQLELFQSVWLDQ